MKQILEGILSLRAKISNFVHYEASNSHNKNEYHFHGPVNFIGRLPKMPKYKINSLLSKVKN